MKISRRRLADHVRKLHQKACSTWSTITGIASSFSIYTPLSLIILDFKMTLRLRRNVVELVF